MIFQPFELRDFRQGRITPASVSESLVPLNSVSFSQNVNFDTIIGKGVVRPGTTLLGAAVAANKAPLGLGEFVGKGGSPNYLMAVFKGASNATLYYGDGSTWTATNLTSLSNSAKNRFATLGGSCFVTNSTDGLSDSSDGATFGTTNSNFTGFAAKPSLVYRYQQRLLASGDPTYPSRVFFSSVIDQASSPFITWDATPSTGDFLDINPDDGGQMTAFAESSTFLLAFKSNGMYRLDVINKTVDAQNIFNIGAVSQEAVVNCQGIVYYFSGHDIRRTTGGFPEQISRAGVQDIIDAIPQANWTSVSAGTDGLNVFFSVGDVTINTNKDTQSTIQNCVLKFSPRDQSWSVHSYANEFQFFSLFTDTNGRKMRGADTAGEVQTIDLGTTDNGTAINYSLETQDLDFGVRSHKKGISNDMVIYVNNGQDSDLQCACNDVYKNIKCDLSKRVNVIDSLDLHGNYLRFYWFGQSSGTPPVFEGLYIESIKDEGMI